MSQAFDAAAHSYDSDFTHRPLARELRDRVWQYVDHTVACGGQMLELGCGTGEDALHFAARGYSVTAIDASVAMLEKARKKIHESDFEDRIELQTVDLRDLRPGVWSQSSFDLVFSNFGVLNCLENLRQLGSVLEEALRPGGRAILILMGRFCPAEIITLLLRGRPRTAFRRWRRPGSEASVGGDARIQVWYPSPRRVQRELGSRFLRVRTLGLGAFLPPPDLADRLESSPRFLDALTRMDRRVAAWPVAPWLSDHYLIDLERVP